MDYFFGGGVGSGVSGTISGVCIGIGTISGAATLI